MKRSTKVGLWVAAAVVVLVAARQGLFISRAHASGTPLGTAVRLSFGISPSCEEWAALSLAESAEACEAEPACDRRDLDRTREEIVAMCRSQGGWAWPTAR